MKHFVTLSEIIKPAKLRRAGEKDYPILSMTMHGGLVDQADKFKKRIASIDTSPYKVIQRNQLVVGFPIDEGVLSFQDLYDEAMVSPAYNVWDLKQPEQVNTAYLQDYLRSPIALNYYASHLRGTTARRRTIPNDVFLQLPVYLPPLAEQQRLAAILDEADALRALRRRGLARFDELAQSLFLELFGDPALNPKNWEMAKLGDICEVKGGKRLPKGDEYSEFPTPFRYIRVSDLKQGAVREENLLYLKPETQSQISRYIVHTDDIIISIAGSIGLIAPVPATLEGANLTENAAKLKAKTNVYNSIFLSHLLQTGYAQSQIGAQTAQVTIGKLALFRIESIEIPLPPLSLQQEFARQIGQLETLKARARAQSVELDALFGALAARAFAGHLSGG